MIVGCIVWLCNFQMVNVDFVNFVLLKLCETVVKTRLNWTLSVKSSTGRDTLYLPTIQYHVQFLIRNPGILHAVCRVLVP